MKFEHYIFDLDGTIVSTKKIHQKSFNQALVSLNHKIIDDNDLPIYEALPSTEKIKVYNNLNNTNIDLEEFIPIKSKFCEENIENSNDIYSDDIFNILKNLKQQAKRISICSNSTEKTIKTIIEKMHIESYIDSFYHNKSCAPKPLPDMYRLAVSESKIDSIKSIIFEDSEVGMKSALESFKDVTVVRVANPDTLKLFFNL